MQLNFRWKTKMGLLQESQQSGVYIIGCHRAFAVESRHAPMKKMRDYLPGSPRTQLPHRGNKGALHAPSARYRRSCGRGADVPLDGSYDLVH